VCNDFHPCYPLLSGHSDQKNFTCRIAPNVDLYFLPPYLAPPRPLVFVFLVFRYSSTIYCSVPFTQKASGHSGAKSQKQKETTLNHKKKVKNCCLLCSLFSLLGWGIRNSDKVGRSLRLGEFLVPEEEGDHQEKAKNLWEERFALLQVARVPQNPVLSSHFFYAPC